SGFSRACRSAASGGGRKAARRFYVDRKTKGPPRRAFRCRFGAVPTQRSACSCALDEVLEFPRRPWKRRSPTRRSGERTALWFGKLVEDRLEVRLEEPAAIGGAQFDPRAEPFLGHRHLDAFDLGDQLRQLGLGLHQGSRRFSHVAGFCHRRRVPSALGIWERTFSDGYRGDVASVPEIELLAREKLGIEQLHPGQLEATRAVLDGRDTLAVMSTGYGKSAIYQLAGEVLGK